MKKAKLFLLCISLLSVIGLIQAQTTEEIISKTVLASGGKEVIGKINTMSIESNTQVMGNEMPTTTLIVNGKGYKNISDMGDQKFIQCYSEKGGWSVNPMTGGSPQALPANQQKAARLQYEIGGPFYDFEAKGNKFELLGKEMVGQVEAFKLKLLTRDSVEITYFIDPATYHIIQTLQQADMMGQEVQVKTQLSDYRTTDFGYVMAFTIDLNYGDQFQLNIGVKKVDFNLTIDPTIFEMPK